jgi:thiamine kinase-like enzyme
MDPLFNPPANLQDLQQPLTQPNPLEIDRRNTQTPEQQLFFQDQGFHLVYDEMIEGVLKDHPGYPKRLLELAATNTNYQVKKGGESYFFRLSSDLFKELYSSQEVEYSVLKQLENTHIAPRPYFFDPKRGILITEYIEHDGITVDLLDQNVQKTVCDMLKRIEKEHLGVDRVFHPYLETVALVKKAATPLPKGFHEKALSALEKISKKLAQYPKKTLCHLDLHRKNILRKGDTLFFIDWEYAAMSHPYHILASMASIERWSDETMWQILGNYTEQPTQEDRHCMALYRIVSDLFWTTWCHLQMENPSTNSPYSKWRDLFFKSAMERIEKLEADQGGAFYVNSLGTLFCLLFCYFPLF